MRPKPFFLRVSSICKPMLIQGRLERTETNLMHIKCEVTSTHTNHIHFKWGSVWIVTWFFQVLRYQLFNIYLFLTRILSYYWKSVASLGGLNANMAGTRTRDAEKQTLLSAPAYGGIKVSRVWVARSFYVLWGLWLSRNYQDWRGRTPFGLMTETAFDHRNLEHKIYFTNIFCLPWLKKRNGWREMSEELLAIDKLTFSVVYLWSQPLIRNYAWIQKYFSYIYLRTLNLGF